MRQYVSCDHLRSHEFLLDSINKTKGRFMSIECESWEKFLQGECFPCQSKTVCIQILSYLLRCLNMHFVCYISMFMQDPYGRFCANFGLPAYDDWVNADESIKNAKTPLKLYSITRNKTPFYGKS